MPPVALVTGSSRGIGRGIAVGLAEAGYDVMVNYARNQSAAEETAQEIRSQGRRAEIHRADVSEETQSRSLVDTTLDCFERLDLLVNNAGIAPAQRLDILEANRTSFQDVLETNLTGPYFLTQFAANRMIELKEKEIIRHPRIVIISSISAFAASPSRGEYCVSKAGLSMMTSLFAVRLAEHGFTVNEIRPGIIETDMTGPVREKYDRLIEEGLTPIRRWGQPEDVAKAVVAIARGYFDFTTGAAIPVDGGFHLQQL